MRFCLAIVIPLMGCGPTAPTFPEAGDVGPASLQLVPADYYSSRPRAVRPGSTKSQQPEDRKPEPVRVDSDMEAAETAERLEQINERLQKFRRSITRSPAP